MRRISKLEASTGRPSECWTAPTMGATMRSSWGASRFRKRSSLLGRTATRWKARGLCRPPWG
eukprot:6015812-Pyramimonas_sp.AAC.1